jgi:adenine-specific DNA-methyltransferase
MSAPFDKLRSKLSELFQLDAAAELDFGIYRILNARRAEVEQFLDGLEGQVSAILEEALHSGDGDLVAELEKVKGGLRAGGFEEDMIAAAPKVRELEEKLAKAAGPERRAALAREIFSHLATFFSRYYKDGDFLSLRRYKKDTYAIPYEGEEVKLHWANADQYYIKSSETLRDYTFRLGPAPKDPAKADTRPAVTFKLVEADTEKDNAKAVAGQERRFVYQGLVGDLTLLDPPASEAPRLVLGFAYLPVGKKEKQVDLNRAAAAAILTEAAKGAFTPLGQRDATYTGKKKEGRTVLDKHLAEYTGRNTFDYFIHKDLGGFLRRELDFYIKNEVVHLDDLEEATEAAWTETRAQLKALRAIAGKVIRFLAQLENFQKRLWLKKKFVVGCDYVVTLDRVPEELYSEIAACEAQREEWVRLFAIDEIEGYSVPLTVEFLKGNRGLPVDTFHLPRGLREAITTNAIALDSPENIVIKSENFGGLHFIQNSFGARVSCIYIDPPYNTGSDGFQYRDAYQHSSWISMIADRLRMGRETLNDDGSIFVSIDDNELANLRHVLDQSYGADNFVSAVIWHKMFSTKNTAQHFSESHDYITVYAKNANTWRPKLIPRGADQDARYKNPDADPRGPWTSGDLSARNYYSEGTYPITCPSGRVISGPPPGMYWRVSETKFKQWDSEGRIWWGKEGNGVPRVKRFLTDVRDGLVPDTIWQHADVGHTQEAKKTLIELYGPNFEQFTTPKPVNLLVRILQLAVPSSQSVLDFFAGSGTTGHAVINLNREDGGDRKYILIEMGEHFDTVLVPRLKKVIYSKDWKDGKPQSRNTGVSHCFKILRLESYEDTLNNLRLHRTREQELALESLSPEAREEYRLGYLLDLESAGSPSLLNVSAFTDPWNYTLDVASGTAGETRPVKVDLVETFHWLLGLTVLAQGRGGGVHWTEGTNPEGEKVLVLWRNTTEVDADALNEWCRKQKISVLDGEFALIYINGDHHLENLRRDDQTWKVRLIDEEFPRLMWEGCE